MSNVITVNSLANSWADHKLAGRELEEGQRALFHERLIYNFKVTALNISSIATIVTVALAFFVQSPLFLILAALTYSTRRCFLNEIKVTGLEGDDKVNALLQRIQDLDLKQQISDQLDIEEENWQPVQSQILDYVVWMNTVPNWEAVPHGEEHAEVELPHAYAADYQ